MCNCTSWMRHLAQARNPYSRSWIWIPGSRVARPGMTRMGHRTSCIMSAKGGHPVIAGVNNRAERPRVTGSSACGDDDSGENSEQESKGRDRSRPLVSLLVMPGLVPGIHVLLQMAAMKSWMGGGGDVRASGIKVPLPKTPL